MNSEQNEPEAALSQDPVATLKQLQQNILNKMEKLQGLNVDYKNKQQKQFLKTFMNIMDKMSTQLMEAKEKYRNIDKQIEKDQKCVKLTKQLKFFRQQCLTLKHQLQQAQQQLQKQRLTNQSLQRQRNQLNRNLLKKSKQAFRYRSRIMSLQKRQTHKNSSFMSYQPNLTAKNNKFISNDSKNVYKQTNSLKKTWHSFNLQNNLRDSSPANITGHFGIKSPVKPQTALKKRRRQ